MLWVVGVSRLKATPSRTPGRLAGAQDRMAVLSGGHAFAIAVAALTAIAFLLRLPHIHETLFLDEHYAYMETHVGGFGEVIHRVRTGGENSPPLYFVLAWASMKLGDPTVTIRLPSLLLGTATVPMLYLLGVRTVGRRAGLIAAALLTFSPFAIFYSSEARPYATMVFLVTCSTLALLVALEKDGVRWWALYALIACGVLYAHYFGAFALIAQGAWAVWTHRDRFRELALAYVAIAVGYIPWLLAFLNQKGNSISDLSSYWPLRAKEVVRELLRLFLGHPNFVPSTLPGRAAVALIGLAIAAALAASAARWLSRRGEERRLPRPSPQIVLLILLAVASPIGFIAYSEIGPHIVIARYMSPALPAATLLVGAILASAPRLVAIPATAVVLAGFAIGAIAGQQPEHQRPPWRDAAHYIDRNAGKSDLVVSGNCAYPVKQSCRRWAYNLGLDVSFQKDHDHTLAAPHAFSDPPPRGRLFVTGVASGLLQAPRPAPGDGMCLLRHTVFAGMTPVVVNEYAQAGAGATLARRDGRDVISLPSGAIPVSPDAATGSVDRVGVQGNTVTVDAWSVGASREPAGCVLVFMNGRLLGSASATESRPDIAKLYGAPAVFSGFKLNVATGGAGRDARLSQVRVFAVSDGSAAELKHS